MTQRDLKLEIQKALDNVPDNALKDVLVYLKSVQNSSPSEVTNAQHLKNILKEDGDLLKRLAQ